MSVSGIPIANIYQDKEGCPNTIVTETADLTTTDFTDLNDTTCHQLLPDPHTNILADIPIPPLQFDLVYIVGHDLSCKPLDGLKVMVGPSCDSGCSLDLCTVEMSPIYGSTQGGYLCKCTSSSACNHVYLSAIYTGKADQRLWTVCSVYPIET